MATIVTGDLYVRLDGKLHEIKRQLRQEGGYGFDPERLARALDTVKFWVRETLFFPLEYAKIKQLN